MMPESLPHYIEGRGPMPDYNALLAECERTRQDVASGKYTIESPQFTNQNVPPIGGWVQGGPSIYEGSDIVIPRGNPPPMPASPTYNYPQAGYPVAPAQDYFKGGYAGYPSYGYGTGKRGYWPA